MSKGHCYSSEEIKKIMSYKHKYADLEGEIGISRKSLAAKRYRLKRGGITTEELEPFVLAIMKKESRHYYIDLYSAYSPYVRDIIYAARKSIDINDFINNSPIRYVSPLRNAMKYFFETEGKLFVSEDDVKKSFYKSNPSNSSHINWNRSIVEDALTYLEDVIEYTKMIIASHKWGYFFII